MSQLTNYSPDEVMCSFLTVIVSGYADGTFIEVERNEDGFTEYVGSGGEVCHTRSLNKTAKVTLTLMQTSPINDLLSAIAIQDEFDGSAYGPFMVSNLNGDTLCQAAECRIAKMPKMERGKDSGTVVWTFMAANMEIFIGGNVI